MIFPFWGFAFGEGSVTTAPPDTAQWAYQMQGRPQRVFEPRGRGDVTVLPGDLRSTDPALDTWEGEAT